MDLLTELESLLKQMEWKDVLDTLQVVVEEMLGHTPNPPPPNAVPAEEGFDSHPQTLEGLSGCGGMPLGVAPLCLERRKDQLDGPFSSQHQNVLHSGFRYSQVQYNNVPVVSLPQVLQENLTPVGFLNGEVVYGVRLFTPTVPPLGISQKRTRESQKDDRPYVKKPLNAFMIFKKEQRPNVEAELNITNSATVNSIIGQRWRALSRGEQDKYYEEAEKERQFHNQLFPDWSARDNYGKKRKRIRKRSRTGAEGSEHLPH